MLIEDRETATRLARALASDIALYNGERVRGQPADAVYQALAKEIGDARRLFQARVAPPLQQQGLFEQALQDVLIKTVSGSAGSPGQQWQAQAQAPWQAQAQAQAQWQAQAQAQLQAQAQWQAQAQAQAPGQAQAATGQTEAQMLEQAHQAAVDANELERKLRGARNMAWLVALLFAASAAALVGWIWMPRLASTGGYDLGAVGQLWTPGIVLLGAVAGITMLVAVFLGSRVIQLRCQQGFSYMLFVTWFWLPFSLLFPYLGGLFALSRTVILFRGKFAAATISSGGSRTRYGAMDIGSAGHPAAFVFLVIAVAQPLVCLATGMNF